jgi:hypothetical protein
LGFFLEKFHGKQGAKFHPKFKENPGPTVPLQLPKNLKKISEKN